jgi:hypothetical protein
MEEIKMARITMTFYEMMNWDVNFTAITAQVFETANLDGEPVAVYENFIREENLELCGNQSTDFPISSVKEALLPLEGAGDFHKVNEPFYATDRYS